VIVNFHRAVLIALFDGWRLVLAFTVWVMIAASGVALSVLHLIYSINQLINAMFYLVGVARMLVVVLHLSFVVSYGLKWLASLLF